MAIPALYGNRLALSRPIRSSGLSDVDQGRADRFGCRLACDRTSLLVDSALDCGAASRFNDHLDRCFAGSRFLFRASGCIHAILPQPQQSNRQKTIAQLIDLSACDHAFGGYPLGDSVTGSLENLQSALAVQNVSHQYKDLLAINDLTLNVPTKQIFGILGPNGSGKSTLFRLVSTLTRVQSGAIEVLGWCTQKNTSEVRKQLGVVFQSPSLDRKLTVLENMRCQAALYGLIGTDRDNRISENIEMLGLGDKLNIRCEKLSGGQKRRVELAKGLLHRPKVLLLDEPSTGLDPAARLDLWQAITQLRDKYGTSIILTTHLLDEADKCDRVAILNAGALVACDSPENLRSETGEMVVCISTNAPKDVARLLKENLRLECNVFDQQVRITAPDAMVSIASVIEMTRTLASNVTVGRPSLEDVFIAKTGHQFHRS
jgi:ABC-2 type transport system ATP-binding protein